MLKYNGISFTYPRTEVNVAGPGMDPSNTDQLYTVIRLKCRAQLNAALSPTITADGGSVSATMARIRHMLTQPRKPLYYDLTSAPAGPVVGPAIIDIPGGRDDANGPYPDADALSVVYTTPGNFEVTWAVTVRLMDCAGFDPNAPLSLRWEDTIEFDRYWKATYKRTGTLILSSLSNISIDAFRRNGLAPAVAKGFAREQAHYTISKDGLRCDFAFVDGQIRYAPPYPAIDMDITQSESLPTAWDGMKHGEVTVQMRGILNANPVDLQYWCTEVAFARLNAADPLSVNGRAIGDAIFTCRESKDSIDAVFTIKYKSPPGNIATTTLQNRGAAWGAIAGGTAGFFVGGPVGAVVGAVGGAVVGNNLAAPSAEGPPTQQGRPTTRVPAMGWVGFGTGAPRAAFPTGYARWAAPGGAITGPADGVLLAPQIALFAALLNDPCGAAAESELRSQPEAQSVATTVRINPEAYNTGGPQGGQGGGAQMSTAQLIASVSAIPAAQYPTTIAGIDASGLYNWDGLPGAYNLIQCQSEYGENPGTIVVPTANPTGKSIKIQFASTQWVLRLRWAASRTGSPPQIPPKQHPDANWVYTGGADLPRELQANHDGVSVIYETSGVYEYMSLDPAKVLVTAAIPPYLSAPALTQCANWLNFTNELRGGTTAFPTAGASLSTGGASPLGYGSLLGNVPP